MCVYLRCRIICIFAYYFDFNNDLFIINNSLVVGSAFGLDSSGRQIADCDLIAATRVQKLRTSIAPLGIHLNTSIGSVRTQFGLARTR